jgi:hypothetical protein
VKNVFYKLTRQACLFGLAFFLATCGGQKKGARYKKGLEDSRFQEARLSDIPVLMDAKCVENKGILVAKSGQNIVQCTSKLPIAEVVDFYEQEMERMGWQQLSAFSGKETVLAFEKPFSVAIIMIRESKKKNATHISVLIGMKS